MHIYLNELNLTTCHDTISLKKIFGKPIATHSIHDKFLYANRDDTKFLNALVQV